ncbi:DUF418 domain-containing protein [Pseudonocardia sp. KRD-291]|nr:DUF418 domain-containing protein [Pseudonocardia sp. KRD291]
MLLLIALAHVPWFLFTSDIGVTLMHPADGGVADRVAQTVTIVAVDGRTHTMFAFLFAYGIGQMYSRQVAGGTSVRDARRLLRTRHWWLLGLGLAHAALLWQGDILGTYGLMGLVLVPLFLNRSDRVLKVWIGVLLGVGALFSVATAALGQLAPAGALPPNPQQLTVATESYLASIPLRLVMWAPTVVSAFATVVLPAAFLLGILAARHRVLEQPARYLTLLRRTAVVGIAIGWSAGLVQGLAHVGALDLPNPAAFGSVHIYTGFFAGIGYAALFGLVAHRIAARLAQAPGGRARPPLPARALLALGRRSLSGYLAQSVIFVPLLAAWGLAFGAHLSSWSVMLVAVASWLLTVVLAYVLDRAGVRGPAETLLRTLTYRSVRRRRQTSDA